MSVPFLSITIGMNPEMFSIGNLVLTWHGLFTLVAVALSVYLVSRWATKEGMVNDAVMSVAVWSIIGGIVGSRLVHVIDRWDDVYRHDPSAIFQVWEGGIAIYGAILGGFAFGAAYMAIRNHPRFLSNWNKLLPWAKLERAPLPSIGRMADLAAPAMLLSMAVGRIGDIINGEHVAKLTDLPWGFVYSHAASPSRDMWGLQASHPAVVYEILLDLAVLAIIWPLRGRLRPQGMIFALYLATYSLGVFFIRFLRAGAEHPQFGQLMDKEWAIGLSEAQFIALIVMGVTVPLLLLKASS